MSRRFHDVSLRVIGPDGAVIGFCNIGFDFVELLGGSRAGADAGRVSGSADVTHRAQVPDAWLGLFDMRTLPFH